MVQNKIKLEYIALHYFSFWLHKLAHANLRLTLREQVPTPKLIDLKLQKLIRICSGTKTVKVHKKTATQIKGNSHRKELKPY